MSADIVICGYNRIAFQTAVTEVLGCEVHEGLTNHTPKGDFVSARWAGDHVFKDGIRVGMITPHPTGDFGPPRLTLTTGFIEPQEIGRLLQQLGDAYGRG